MKHLVGCDLQSYLRRFHGVTRVEGKNFSDVIFELILDKDF